VSWHIFVLQKFSIEIDMGINENNFTLFMYYMGEKKKEKKRLTVLIVAVVVMIIW
jgi:hypothetical protein